MIFEYSDKDLLQSKIVDPAWYRVRITACEDRASNDGQSVNTWLKGEILYNADSKDTKFAGVPTPYLWLFNSKAPFSTVGFTTALEGKPPSQGERREISANTTVGREVEMFIANGEYNGQTTNAVSGKYRIRREDVKV